jgi:hypothetical protein
MQMLGAQVLLGFEFQGLFQDGFAKVSLICRSVDAVGLGLPAAVRETYGAQQQRPATFVPVAAA